MVLRYALPYSLFIFKGKFIIMCGGLRLIRHKALLLIYALVLAIVVLSGSIAVPILFRPFYYIHIWLLGLTQSSGLSTDVIIEAFNDVMDYCTGLTDNFSAGILTWSESGAAHFADVRKLFILDLGILAISLVTIVLLTILIKKLKLSNETLLKHRPSFWSAIVLIGMALVIGLAILIDFDSAFTLFHKILFRGKDNWVLFYLSDPIILLLPEQFFMNCGLLVLSLIAFWCCISVYKDRRLRHNLNRGDSIEK